MTMVNHDVPAGPAGLATTRIALEHGVPVSAEIAIRVPALLIARGAEVRFTGRRAAACAKERDLPWLVALVRSTHP